MRAAVLYHLLRVYGDRTALICAINSCEDVRSSFGPMRAIRPIEQTSAVLIYFIPAQRQVRCIYVSRALSLTILLANFIVLEMILLAQYSASVPCFRPACTERAREVLQSAILSVLVCHIDGKSETQQKITRFVDLDGHAHIVMIISVYFYKLDCFRRPERGRTRGGILISTILRCVVPAPVNLDERALHTDIKKISVLPAILLPYHWCSIVGLKH